jgi:hypothetical protein
MQKNSINAEKLRKMQKNSENAENFSQFKKIQARVFHSSGL